MHPISILIVNLKLSKRRKRKEEGMDRWTGGRTDGQTDSQTNG
jgi:hypothetical protein